MRNHDAPPPPYSETDLFSHPGGGIPQYYSSAHASSRPSRPESSESPHPAATEAGSTASTAEEAIYTPPLTPQTTHHGAHSKFAHTVSDSSPPLAPEDPTHVVCSAAQHYFQSRPPPRTLLNTTSVLEHVLEIRPESQPSNFPYPGGEFAARDVGLQDWLTFRNFLFPARSTLATVPLLDTKLRGEQESHVRYGRAGEDSTSTGSNAFEQARLPARENEQPGHQNPRRRQQESTVSGWNLNFFLPRGILVRLAPALWQPMPGAFEPGFDPLVQASREPQPPPQAHTHPQQQQARHNNQQHGPLPCPRGGIRLGKITIDSNGVRLGNSLVADGNGIKVGNLTMDAYGIRYGNNNLLPGRPGGGDPRCCRGNFTIPMLPPMPGVPMGPPPGPTSLDNSHPNPVRGRSLNAQPSNSRSSSSSACTSSSSSSSTTDSSVGSLPSLADLGPNQLPVLQDRLQEWLAGASHPSSAPLTRENIAALRAEIRSADGRNTYFRDASAAGALRKEIKVLVAEFKALKRRQRKESKKEKRERKMRKKAEKRERRRQTKDMRRARRGLRQGLSGGTMEETGGAQMARTNRSGIDDFQVPPTIRIPRSGGGMMNMLPTAPVMGRRGCSWGQGDWTAWGRCRGGPWGARNKNRINQQDRCANWTQGNWGEPWSPGCNGTSPGRDSHCSGDSGLGGRSPTATRSAITNPFPSANPGPGFFSGLFPGAWAGENLEDVPAHAVEPERERSQSARHSASEAMYAAAAEVEVQVHQKESQLVIMQEFVEGMERELESRVSTLVSEIEEHERAAAAAATEAERVCSLKRSKIEDLEKQLWETCTIRNFQGRRSSKSSSTTSSSGEKNTVKEKVAEIFEEKLEAEIQKLKEENRAMSISTRECQQEVEERKRKMDETVRETRTRYSAEVAQMQSQARSVEGQILSLEREVERMRLEADEMLAREIQEMEKLEK